MLGLTGFFRGNAPPRASVSCPDNGRYVTSRCPRIVPTTQISDTTVRYLGGYLDLSSLVPSRLSLSPPYLNSKQQGEEGCHGACASSPRLELAQPPAPCVSRPYPTRPLRVAAGEPRVTGELRAARDHTDDLRAPTSPFAKVARR